MRTKDVADFNTSAHKSTVEDMARRREAVHTRGEEIYRRTGKLGPNVDIFGKKRVSHNALVKEDGKARLTRGIKMPIVYLTDGTGSMGENVGKAFLAMGEQFAMLNFLADLYQPDLSVGVVQDVCDRHPPHQMAEWESDNRAADHIRDLVPDHGGGDETEDYQLGLWYLLTQTDVDIHRYGLKPYCLLVADQICREQVRPDEVSTYLGHAMSGQMSTRDVCQKLLANWHLFYVQVGSGGGGSNNWVTDWWRDKMGRDRVVIVPDPDRLAEVQAGLVYATETLQPTREGMVAFLLAGGANKRLSDSEATEVWGWIEKAGIPFGAQARLPGYDAIPKPGDLFAHYRDTWPIGHPRAGENPPHVEGEEAVPAEPPAEAPDKTEGKPIDWSRF